MNILITGGRGFIAGYLSDFLLKYGNNVKVASRGLKADFNSELVEKFEYVHVDWTCQESLLELCKGIDVVIHAAGLNASDCQRDPILALEVNGINTSKLIRAAVINKVKKFIFLSTVHVYGQQLIGSINENTFPINFHPYATSNRAGENVVISSYLNNMIDAYVLRISNTFGIPRLNQFAGQDLVINDLCRQAVVLNSMTIKSSGVQVRNFIPIQEFSNIINFLILKSECNSVRRWDDIVINVGSYNTFSIINIANLIKERTFELIGKTPLISIENKGSGLSSNIEIFKYDIQLLVSLGYDFKFNFVDELDKLILYYNSLSK